MRDGLDVDLLRCSWQLFFNNKSIFMYIFCSFNALKCFVFIQNIQLNIDCLKIDGLNQLFFLYFDLLFI